MNRQSLATAITTRLAPLAEELKAQWAQSGHSHFVVDDLLDPDLAMDIHRRFPSPSSMMTRKSLREHKHVAAQMDQFDPLLEEIVFGFQEAGVREITERITGIPDLRPDSRLYAGGISLMSRGHFLNPHLDNSHDNDRSAYRALNLLYYVSPDWNIENGGNLELWPNGVGGKPIVMHSKFNRLVVMATNQTSWHSVNRVQVDRQRCCVSNYFFSTTPPGGQPYFHVTSFKGRPEEPVRNLLLQADVALRTGIRRLFPRGIRQTKHIYKK
jgi:Rps23 Pro-64 3,4-dihydroxylase Tpa1-like proline 4-hydroxylase